MSAEMSSSKAHPHLNNLTRDDRKELRRKLRSIQAFASGLVGVRLRPYQWQAADAIVRSVFARDGDTFVIVFARQSGKDELLANLILFILARLAERGGSIVCAQPTFQPQTVLAMDRLQYRAAQRPFFRDGNLHRLHGNTFEFGAARVTYLSGDPSASVVGATADRLLIINEAQDVQPGVYDKRFAPMAAAGNATRVFSGTSWTHDTLLEREKKFALQREKSDGLRRVFQINGRQVARHNKLYGAHLQSEILRLGRGHPLIRTQYFCENIDARSGMFTAAHRALMQCDRDISVHLRSSPVAFLLDVAGMEESSTASPRADAELFDPHSNSTRDSATLRIVEPDLSTLETLQAPTYRAVHLQQWTGLNHLTLFGQLKSLAEFWRPLYIVMDATGVGEGLWAMLDKSFPSRVTPVKFTQQVKSELGYGFLAIINTGRFRDCVSDPSLRRLIDQQYAACESEILPGPAKIMRWGVPEGRRDADGQLIHDDIPVADSLTAILDRLDWSIRTPGVIIHPPDPLGEMDRYHRKTSASNW